MIVTSSLDALAAKGMKNAAVACGMFDGVHRGHQRLLRALSHLSEQSGAHPVVLTFDPHPRAVLYPDNPPDLLTTNAQKVDRFRECGAEAAVILNFSRDLAARSAQDFLHEYLLSPALQLAGVCVGAKWRFGARGEGDVRFLEQAGKRHNFHVVSVDEVQWYGQPVSSTRIRQALRDGRLKAAERMLGRPYAVRGQVVHGKGIGNKTFQCPTANLVVVELLLPPDGVYAARGTVLTHGITAADQPKNGVAYIGRAPTVTQGKGEMVFEFHFFETQKNLYGEHVEVELLEYLRPDKRFASREALHEQMQRDMQRARHICKEPAS